jgi:hypothetical protein
MPQPAERSNKEIWAPCQQLLSREDCRAGAKSDKSICSLQYTAKIKGKRFRHGLKGLACKFLRGWMLKSTKGWIFLTNRIRQRFGYGPRRVPFLFGLKPEHQKKASFSSLVHPTLQKERPVWQ